MPTEKRIITLNSSGRSNTGSSFWESTKLRSFRNPESGDVLLFFYTIDITEQKLQEQLLKRIAEAGL